MKMFHSKTLEAWYFSLTWRTIRKHETKQFTLFSTSILVKELIMSVLAALPPTSFNRHNFNLLWKTPAITVLLFTFSISFCPLSFHPSCLLSSILLKSIYLYSTFLFFPVYLFLMTVNLLHLHTPAGSVSRRWWQASLCSVSLPAERSWRWRVDRPSELWDNVLPHRKRCRRPMGRAAPGSDHSSDLYFIQFYLRSASFLLFMISTFLVDHQHEPCSGHVVIVETKDW